MRKNVILALSVLLCVCLLSFMSVSGAGVSNNTSENSNTNVVTVANNNTVNSKVLEPRFLNMLNHSFVYNDDFQNDQTLVNNSVLGLLNLAEDGFVNENYVTDYIFNMYGIKISDFGSINADCEQKDGYVYIIPRGYSEYKHTVLSVTDNNDGSYTVVTNVEISLDDGSVINDTATTVFLKNIDSQFGYNIVYSEIGTVTENTVDC